MLCNFFVQIGVGQDQDLRKAPSELGLISFFCLADKEAMKPPNTTEKLTLQKAGLGLKKIQFQVTDNEESVLATLTGPEGFPQLKDVGGFELLHCQSNCREFQLITCSWSVESLKKVIGSQAKIYVRPIQKNLKVNDVENEGPSNLKEACSKCSKEFPISELRQHVLSCIESDDQESLPDLLNEETSVIVHVPPILMEQTFTTDDIQVLSYEENIQNKTSALSDFGDQDELPQLLETQIHQQARTEDNVFQHVSDVGPLNSSSELQLASSSVHGIVDETADYCLEHGISDPIEILRYYQQKIVLGRKLDIEDDSEVIEGETNFILIDRNQVLESALEEISGITNLRTCLEVQFYGEASCMNTFTWYYRSIQYRMKIYGDTYNLQNVIIIYIEGSY